MKKLLLILALLAADVSAAMLPQPPRVPPIVVETPERFGPPMHPATPCLPWWRRFLWLRPFLFP